MKCPCFFSIAGRRALIQNNIKINILNSFYENKMRKESIDSPCIIESDILIGDEGEPSESEDEPRSRELKKVQSKIEGGQARLRIKLRRGK